MDPIDQYLKNEAKAVPEAPTHEESTLAQKLSLKPRLPVLRLATSSALILLTVLLLIILKTPHPHNELRLNDSDYEFLSDSFSSFSLEAPGVF